MKQLKRRTTVVYALFLILVMGLAACNLEGIGGFSPSGARAAVVRDSSSLYTTNNAGGDVVEITENLGAGFDTTFNPSGSGILYVDSDEQSICVANPESGSASCSPVNLGGVSGGVLSYLPNGHVILVYRNGSTFEMRIYDNSWNTVRSESNFDQFFLTTSAYKVKRGHDGTQWYLRPYNDEGGLLRWVITRGEDAFSYTANSGGVGGPNPLPARISPAVQSTLAGRELEDITSGAVSPDGNTLVFRTGDGATLYSLYVMDLTRSDGSFTQLVDGANFRIEYAFAPDGSEIAYESNAGGRSVWIANADGSNARQLAAGASLPGWR